MVKEITICDGCNAVWDTCHDSKSILCSNCGCETKPIKQSISKYILERFRAKADTLYYSLPEDNEDFKPNGKFNEDPLSYFSEEIHNILKYIIDDIKK